MVAVDWRRYRERMLNYWQEEIIKGNDNNVDKMQILWRFD
jgi:hypothetical protein